MVLKNYLRRALMDSYLWESTRKKSEFRKNFGLSKTSIILDCGCGFGWKTLQMANEGLVTIGMDIKKDFKKIQKFKLKTKPHFIIASADSIPFKKDVFDLIYSSHVIEHVLNQKLMISELKRVIKPNGWLLLIVPNMKNLSTSIERKFSDATHLREYTKKDLKVLLTGFRIIKMMMKDFSFPVVGQLWHFIIVYLRLRRITDLFAKIFPFRSLEIKIVAQRDNKTMPEENESIIQ